MAARLWILVATSGCLMPPPIEEGDPVENHPPRIVPQELSPPPASLPAVLSIDCPRYPFFASVADSDPNDIIYWRVFIDYATNTVLQKTEGAEVSELPANPVRPGSGRVLSFPVRTDDLRFFGDGDARFSTTHVIELLIADRPFEDLREPRGRVVEAEGLTDTFVWPVHLTQDPPELGSCPAEGS